MNDEIHHARIAIVDDDSDIRSMLSAVLGSAGYDVVSARNGCEALDVLRSNPAVSLIVLDLTMPVMNGWEFRAAQLADPGLREVPVLLLSGELEVRTVAADLHAAAALAKPVDVDLLLSTVETVLAGPPGDP